MSKRRSWACAETRWQEVSTGWACDWQRSLRRLLKGPWPCNSEGVLSLLISPSHLQLCRCVTMPFRMVWFDCLFLEPEFCVLLGDKSPANGKDALHHFQACPDHCGSEARVPTVRYFKFQDFNILSHTVPLLEDNQKSFAILEDMTEKQKGVSPGLLQLGHFLGMDCGTKLLTLWIRLFLYSAGLARTYFTRVWDFVHTMTGTEGSRKGS